MRFEKEIAIVKPGEVLYIYQWIMPTVNGDLIPQPTKLVVKDQGPKQLSTNRQTNNKQGVPTFNMSPYSVKRSKGVPLCLTVKGKVRYLYRSGQLHYHFIT